MYLPVLSALIAIIAFNTQLYFLIFFSLVPLFLFLIREKRLGRLILGSALFRLFFALGTVYFVIDPILYTLSILIFLGLPLSFYLVREKISPLAAEAALPFLWTLWDYLEAQYTLLPMTIAMLGIPLADSPFLGLASFGGVIGLTFFAVFINLAITFLILERHQEKHLFQILVSLIVILLAVNFSSLRILNKNKADYLVKKNFLNLEILSVSGAKTDLDNSIMALAVRKDTDLLLLPENWYRSHLENWDKLIQFYQKIAESVGVPTSVITLRKDGNKVYKSNLVFSENGEVLDMYDKNFLTITSEYWPFAGWRPFYMKPELDSDLGIGKAVFDSSYLHQSGRPKLIDLGRFSFAAPICIEFHYSSYLRSLNKLGSDFIIHNSNNDWINSGLDQYLTLVNKLRTIEAVHFKKPVVVNGVKDFAGIFYPDGTSELVYPKNGLSLVNLELRF